MVRCLAAILLVALIPPLAAASSDRAALEKELTDSLTAQHPEALLPWLEANTARQRGDHQAAARLYTQVVEKAPGFTAALRRLGGEKLALGDRAAALRLDRQAVTMEASAPNRVALALVLASNSGGTEPTTADLEEAVRLGELAAQESPDDFYSNAGLAQVALAAGDHDHLAKAVKRLLVVAPDDDATHQFAAFLAVTEGRAREAETELRRARELGMPEDRYQALSQAFARARPRGPRLLALLGWAGAAWLGILCLLFVSGVLLSRAVLRAAERLPREASGRAQGTGSSLRRIYAMVLWLSCAYYYVSLPIVALVVLLAGGGIVYAMLAAGRIPVKLLVIVVVVTFATLWAILKSLFVRAKDTDPGERLDLRTEPRLRTLLGDVARRIGTRPVDRVYLTPGTDVAVMERGGLTGQLRGRAERCLILGVGVLDGLKIGPLKAVLAHEYGHFSNRDTAGGGFALSVRRSLLAMAVALAQGGAAAWYNPAWLFLNGFYRAFLRISQGASRLQEILADRWAAFTYGSKAFEDGLRHVIEQTVRFDARAARTLDEMARLRGAVANLYAHVPESPVPEADLTQAVREALNRRPSPYDSHPSPAERTRWVRALNARGTVRSPEDGDDAWTLFADRAAVEQRMTAIVQDAILRSANVA